MRVLSFAVTTILFLGGCGISNSEVENSPGVDHPDTAGFRVVTRTEFDDPIPAYSFELVNQNNEVKTLDDYRGQVVMMGFIYTHCPEACPLVAANFKRVQEEMPEASEAGELKLVLITTDPEQDTPERLLNYTQALRADWDFLTGSVDVMEDVYEGFNVFWEIRERTKEVVVYHSYKTYLIDKEGFIRYEFVGVWYPDDIKPDINVLIQENGD